MRNLSNQKLIVNWYKIKSAYQLFQKKMLFFSIIVIYHLIIAKKKKLNWILMLKLKVQSTVNGLMSIPNIMNSQNAMKFISMHCIKTWESNKTRHSKNGDMRRFSLFIRFPFLCKIIIKPNGKCSSNVLFIHLMCAHILRKMYANGIENA